MVSRKRVFAGKRGSSSPAVSDLPLTLHPDMVSRKRVLGGKACRASPPANALLMRPEIAWKEIPPLGEGNRILLTVASDSFGKGRTNILAEPQ